MRFILHRRKTKLVISTSTNFTANGIDRSLLYIVLGVNSRVKKITNVKLVQKDYIDLV